MLHVSLRCLQPVTDYIASGAFALKDSLGTLALLGSGGAVLVFVYQRKTYNATPINSMPVPHQQLSG